MNIKALVPIRMNSSRLKNKNFLDFCGEPLYQIVLNTLQSIDLIDEIIVDTDSPELINALHLQYSKVRIIQRPEYLRGANVTMNKLIAYDLSVSEGEYFLQTHCTNPLLTKDTIISAITAYFNGLEKFDSLFSVDRIQKRAYHSDGNTINHSNERLEQTQDLNPICIENSNLFLFSRTSFMSTESRIGNRPSLFPMNPTEGIDIDYEYEFKIAELIYMNKNKFDFLI